MPSPSRSVISLNRAIPRQTLQKVGIPRFARDKKTKTSVTMPHMATRAAAPATSKVAVRSLIVLVLINIVNFYDRQVPGALAEPIRKEFGLTDTQLGLIGTAFTILYAIVGIPLGRMADRGSR